MSTLVLLALIGMQPASLPMQPDSSPIQLNHCKVEYKQSTKLGAPMFGMIQSLYVRRGDVVKAGQVLANLPINEESSDLVVNSALAESDVAVRLATVQHRQAESRALISKRLHDRNACSTEQYNFDLWTAEAARIAIEQAKENRKIAQLNCERAKARIAAKQIIAPHAGIVSEIAKQQGESIGMGETCIRIDDPSVLQIAGFLDIRDVLRIKVGDRAKVRFDTAAPDIDAVAGFGIVTYIDTKIDPTKQTRLVIVEVPNDTRIPLAGLEASLQFVSEVAAR